MAEKMNFTIKSLTGLEVPKGKDRITVYDTKTPGLAITVRGTGGRTFYLIRRAQGQSGRLRLGAFPAMTVEQARKAATRENGNIAEGGNPFRQKQEVREQSTLGDLFHRFMESHAKVKKSWQEDEGLYNRYLSHWKNRPLTQITYPEVAALHNRVGKDHGHVAANRMVSLLGKMFAEAGKIGFAGPNPARGVERFKEHERERYLLADELPKFFEALRAEPSATFRDFFLMALFTGARKSNVQAMAWNDIDLSRAVWTIPAAQAKGGKQMGVYLAPPALAILTERHAEREKLEEEERSPWVFTSRRKMGGVRQPISEPQRAWDAVCKRAGIENLRIHDLRRTLGSWQIASGASLAFVQKTLGHKDIKTTGIYARMSLDPIRESVDSATNAMLAAGVAK